MLKTVTHSDTFCLFPRFRYLNGDKAGAKRRPKVEKLLKIIAVFIFSSNGKEIKGDNDIIGDFHDRLIWDQIVLHQI